MNNNINEIKKRNKNNLSNFTFDYEPLVSIIILNKNGCSYLKNLFKDFKENTNYDNYEIIVVDNNSTDDSVDYLKSINNLPIKVIENDMNKSFSEANNEGVKVSNGELVLLMNNDIETTYGWLNELVGNLLSDKNIGAVGPKLIYPFLPDHVDFSYTIQAAGDKFLESFDLYTPYNSKKNIDLWDDEVNHLQDVISITGAVLLISKELYNELGGLDLIYYYCFEDVDLCLKLHEKGYKIRYCPNALLMHHESPTRKENNDIRANVKENKIRFNKKWGDYLFRNILKDKFEYNQFFTDEKLFISIIHEKGIITSNVNEYKKLLVNNFKKSDFEIEINNYNKRKFQIKSDIILSLNPYFDPLKAITKLNIIKIAWIVEDDDEWLSQLDFYDFIIYSSKEAYNKNPNGNKCFIDLFSENLIDEFKNIVYDNFIN